MTSDLDIYRSANILVKHLGEDAPIRVAMVTDAMLEKGDPVQDWAGIHSL